MLDSTSIMELENVPEHLLVLGGGYVGLEFGQMFRRFGSRVTIIQRGKQLLPREDPDVAEAVTQILCEDGLEVLLQTQTGRAQQSNGKIQLTIRSTWDGTDRERVLTGSGRGRPCIECRSPEPRRRGRRNGRARLVWA